MSPFASLLIAAVDNSKVAYTPIHFGIQILWCTFVFGTAGFFYLKRLNKKDTSSMSEEDLKKHEQSVSLCRSIRYWSQVAVIFGGALVVFGFVAGYHFKGIGF